MAKVRYALQHPQEREGEFMFLCSSQSHFVRSEQKARQELESFLDPKNAGFMCCCDISPEHPDGWRLPTRKEVIAEMGKVPKIYKLTIEEVDDGNS